MPRGFIPVPNTASAELIFTLSGVTFENTLHVEKGSPFSLADLQSLRGVLTNWVNTSYKSWYFSGCTLQRVRTRALDTANAPMEDYQLPSPIAGTAGPGGTPLNVAFCLKLPSGLSGRSARGRWYAGAIPSGAVGSPSDINAVNANGYVTSLNALKTTLTAAGYTWVVTSFRSGGAWRATGVNFAITGAAYTDLHFDSQRRRLLGRGQ